MLSRSLFRRIHSRSLSSRATDILAALDIHTGDVRGVYHGEWCGSGEPLKSTCPTTGDQLARVLSASPQDVATTIDKARDAQLQFRLIPAPKRGEILRKIRVALAAKKHELGALVSLEMGKIQTEGVGEVQEFVDIVSREYYATGLSRMMNGRIVASERPGHTIYECCNPLGLVAVISAFNFPVAVYGWNLALSLAAGNATLWKPAPTTPLCAVAVTKIVANVLEKNDIPGAVAALVTGGSGVGSALVESELVPLVSFTGSENAGRRVAKICASRFAKSILELGGNNASIILPDADISLAVPAVFFGAVGTAGQRCTSTRRLYLHRDIADDVLERLRAMYASVHIGDPLDARTLLGPMHSQAGLATYDGAISALRAADAELLTPVGRASAPELRAGNFVLPVIAVPASADPAQELWRHETFAPILKVAVFDELNEAVAWNNAVPQGLASSIWTRDVRSVGRFIGPAGSDCGIVNVNVGTSGAEIGAAFGGNKTTGWGRESGGDAWKEYVRWSACTVNFSDSAPLAQGVTFDA